MSDLNLNLPVDDRDGICLQGNFAGHAGGFAGGDVKRSEVERALHDLAANDAFF
jgi:hypothetical protein